MGLTDLFADLYAAMPFSIAEVHAKAVSGNEEDDATKGEDKDDGKGGDDEGEEDGEKDEGEDEGGDDGEADGGDGKEEEAEEEEEEEEEEPVDPKPKLEAGMLFFLLRDDLVEKLACSMAGCAALPAAREELGNCVWRSEVCLH